MKKVKVFISSLIFFLFVLSVVTSANSEVVNINPSKLSETETRQIFKEEFAVAKDDFLLKSDEKIADMKKYAYGMEVVFLKTLRDYSVILIICSTLTLLGFCALLNYWRIKSEKKILILIEQRLKVIEDKLKEKGFFVKRKVK